jgi:hypothetical protein
VSQAQEFIRRHHTSPFEVASAAGRETQSAAWKRPGTLHPAALLMMLPGPRAKHWACTCTLARLRLLPAQQPCLRGTSPALFFYRNRIVHLPVFPSVAMLLSLLCGLLTFPCSSQRQQSRKGDAKSSGHKKVEYEFMGPPGKEMSTNGAGGSALPEWSGCVRHVDFSSH